MNRRILPLLGAVVGIMAVAHRGAAQDIAAQQLAPSTPSHRAAPPSVMLAGGAASALGTPATTSPHLAKKKAKRSAKLVAPASLTSRKSGLAADAAPHHMMQRGVAGVMIPAGALNAAAPEHHAPQPAPAKTTAPVTKP